MTETLDRTGDGTATTGREPPARAGVPDHGAVRAGAPDHGAAQAGAPDHGAAQAGAPAEGAKATGDSGSAGSPTSAGGDVLTTLAGIPAGGHVDSLRALRPTARENAQLAHDLLFHPADDGPVTRVERLAVAVVVAGLHRHERATAHYGSALADAGGGPELLDALARETDAAAAPGPVGTYREPGLAAESVPAAPYRVTAHAVLGERLSAAVEHARLLVLNPRDARPERLEALVAAGWDEDGIVTLSQLVAYLAYQIRAAVGLSALHAAPAQATPTGGSP